MDAEDDVHAKLFTFLGDVVEKSGRTDLNIKRQPADDVLSLMQKVKFLCYPREAFHYVVSKLCRDTGAVTAAEVHAFVFALSAYEEREDFIETKYPLVLCTSCKEAVATVGLHFGFNRRWCWSCYIYEKNDYIDPETTAYGTTVHRNWAPKYELEVDWHINLRWCNRGGGPICKRTTPYTIAQLREDGQRRLIKRNAKVNADWRLAKTPPNPAAVTYSEFELPSAAHQRLMSMWYRGAENDIGNGEWRVTSSTPVKVRCRVCSNYEATVFAYPCMHAVSCLHCYANDRSVGWNLWSIHMCPTCTRYTSYYVYEHRYALMCDKLDDGKYTLIVRRAAGVLGKVQIRSIFQALPFQRHVAGSVNLKSPYAWLRTLVLMRALEHRGDLPIPFANVLGVRVDVYPMYSNHKSLPVLSRDAFGHWERVSVVVKELDKWISMSVYHYAHLAGLSCAYYEKCKAMGDERYTCDMPRQPPLYNPIHYLISMATSNPPSGSTKKETALLIANTIGYYAELKAHEIERIVLYAALIVAHCYRRYLDELTTVSHVLKTISGGALHTYYGNLCNEAVMDITENNMPDNHSRNDADEMRFDSRAPVLSYNKDELDYRGVPKIIDLWKRSVLEEMCEFANSTWRPFGYMQVCGSMSDKFMPQSEARHLLEVYEGPLDGEENANLMHDLTHAFAHFMLFGGPPMRISVPNSRFANEQAFRIAIAALYPRQWTYVNKMVEYAFCDTMKPERAVAPAGCGYEMKLADGLKYVGFMRSWFSTDASKEEWQRAGHGNYVVKKVQTLLEGPDRSSDGTLMRYPEDVTVSDESQVRWIMHKFYNNAFDGLPQFTPFNYNTAMTNIINSPNAKRILEPIMSSMSVELKRNRAP